MKTQRGRFETKEDGKIEFIPDESGRWNVVTPDEDIKVDQYYISATDPFSDTNYSDRAIIVARKDDEGYPRIVSHYIGLRNYDSSFHNEVLSALKYYNAPLITETEMGKDFAELEPWEYYNKFCQVDGKPVKPVTKEEWEAMTNSNQFHNRFRRRR